jgi:hypothetical protein
MIRPLTIALFLLVQSQLLSQTDINPFRIGIKVGIPDGIALGVEYVTPLLGNRIAPYADYGFIKVDDVDSNYFEIGSNIYFRNTGNGGYGSIAYGNWNATVSNLSGETEDEREYTNGVAEEQLSSFNLKIGGKWGRKVYFRLEAGYAFGKLPREIVILGEVDGQTEPIVITFDEAFDYISGQGYPLFNLGLGYSF